MRHCQEMLPIFAQPMSSTRKMTIWGWVPLCTESLAATTVNGSREAAMRNTTAETMRIFDSMRREKKMATQNFSSRLLSSICPPLFAAVSRGSKTKKVHLAKVTTEILSKRGIQETGGGIKRVTQTHAVTKQIRELEEQILAARQAYYSDVWVIKDWLLIHSWVSYAHERILHADLSMHWRSF